MQILKYALYNPVKVIVAVFFIVLFGTQALMSMPYQLSPSVEYPTITVRTSWTGATPYEVEREIVERQENVLKSLPGLMEMESTSNNGSGSITLQFELGVSLTEATLNVTNKLNEVRNYPDDVDRPVIRASGGSDSTPVVFMLFTLDPSNPRDLDSYQNYVEDEIVPRFERIKGVSEVFFFGGRATQMEVVVQPEKMAAYGITAEQFMSALTGENVNISAGTLDVGRKSYRVRTVSEFTTVDDINRTIVLVEEGAVVRVEDLAEVGYGYAKSQSAVKEGRSRTMMIGIVKEPGANVLELTDTAEATFRELNAGELADRGITLKWVYDQRPYINGAISLVKDNIVLGGILAVLVLLVFLRSITSTVIVFTAIPISVIGTFIMLNLLGRTLNVISLAGIAFAVSMLIDNAIVVLENIDRHRQMGKPPGIAAFDGASEVWGAVLASTLTTVAVFLPVVFIQQEAGQLFRDIAIAISCAVLLSLVVSLLVIPMITRLFYERLPHREPGRISRAIACFGTFLQDGVMKLSDWINRSTLKKVLVVFIFTAFSVGMVYLLYPKMEYLPLGNMNMISSVFNVPPGLSLDERSALGDIFYEKVEPYMGVGRDSYPAIENFFYFINPGGMQATATSADTGRAADLVPLLSGLVKQVPGVTGFTSQSGIFQNRGSGGRSIDVVVTGEDLDSLVAATIAIQDAVRTKIPGVQVRPRPSPEMVYPEMTFYPISSRVSEMNMTSSTLGRMINIYVDGRKTGEFRDDDLGNIDLMVMVPGTIAQNPTDIGHMPMATPRGGVVPVSSLAEMEEGFGMNAIRRYERKRAFNLSVSAPEDMVLEELTDRVRNDIIAPLGQTGMLDRIDILYQGSASKLAEAKDALIGNFIMALIITYLLMAALFNNFFYPLIIMFSVPLALAGGFIGLEGTDRFLNPQSFDILTMLGFIILVGLVVNGAILIVHQTLNNINMYHMPVEEAISRAVRDRLRPIMMGAGTSLFGLMPLVVIPGPGSELYRGLGSVVLGGLTISTLFIIFLIPALFSLLSGVMFRKKKDEAVEE